MRLVKLPAVFTERFASDPEVMSDMFNSYKAIMMVTVVDNEMWVRVSAQICSTKQEYRYVAKAVKQRAKELEQELAS